MQKSVRSFVTVFEDILGTFALVAIFAVMLAGVFFRYVLNDSLVWSEEFARYGLVTLTFLGIGTGFRRASHVRIDALSEWFASRTRIVEVGSLLASAAFMGVLLIQSIALSRILGSSRSAALGMPMSWLYLTVAVGLGIGVLRAGLAILGHIRTPLK